MIDKQRHNEILLELSETLYDAVDGPNSSAMLIVESLAVRTIILSANESNITKGKLLKTLLEGIKNRVQGENFPNFNQ
jgi:hypothetical protein